MGKSGSANSKVSKTSKRKKGNDGDGNTTPNQKTKPQGPKSKSKSEESLTPIRKFYKDLSEACKALNMKCFVHVRYVTPEYNEDDSDPGSEEDGSEKDVRRCS